MPVFLVPVDASEENADKEAEVTNQEIIVGRSFLVFNCNDARISRNQGILTHSTDSEIVTIKSTHLNPLYYKTDGNSNIGILLKEKVTELKHNDEFGFLPDKFWYKIVIKNKETVEPLLLRVRHVAELNDSQNLAEIIPEVSNGAPPMSSSQEISSPSQSLEDNLIVLPTPDIFPVVASSEPVPESSEVEKPESSSTKRVADEEQSDTSPKRQKNERAEAATVPAASSTSDDNPCQSSTTTTTNQQSEATSSTSTGTCVVKKEEPDSTDNLRDSCQFGIRCYRRDPEHQRELAHPGDDDYRRPNYPPAPPGTPMCPFGARCYRRNPDHFLEYAHPPSTGASCSTTTTATSSSTNGPAWLPKPKIAPKTEQMSDEGSEEEEDGDFGSDSDEEFQINAVNEETDDDESESEGEESDDNSAILDDGDANED